MRTSFWTTPNWTSGTPYIRPHMRFTMRHEILFTPARTRFLQRQNWGFWIPKLLLFLVQHYDQNIHEKCLHLCECQCLSFFASILWCIQNGDGLKQDLTKYGWKLNMKINFGEHILLFFGATYMNLMKRFGDLLNFWSKSNERKSPKKKDIKTFNSFPCSQCVPIMFPMCTRRCSQNHLGFIPYGFLRSSTPMYIMWKGVLEGNTFLSVLQLGSKEVLPLGSVVSKKLMMGQWIWLFQKEKKTKLCAHPWTN